jgi:hypothetical protein
MSEQFTEKEASKNEIKIVLKNAVPVSFNRRRCGYCLFEYHIRIYN